MLMILSIYFVLNQKKKKNTYNVANEAKSYYCYKKKNPILIYFLNHIKIFFIGGSLIFYFVSSAQQLG